MDIPSFTSFLNLGILLVAVTFGIYFLMLYRRDRARQLDREERRLDYERQIQHEQLMETRRLREEQIEQAKRNQDTEESRLYEQRRLQEEQLELQKEQLRQVIENAAQQMTGAGTGGYIILDLPESRRSLFHDLLKGFEEYAQLKGYAILFSVDNTFPDKIAFKFTLADNVVNVSTERVRSDLKEYIQTVQSGEPLDDLPVVLPEEQHNLLLTTMKNRINFLQHSYNLKKNAVEFYERLLQKVTASPYGILPPPNIMIQTGGSMESKSYNAVNSSRLLQGEHNSYSDLSNNITIAESFNERKNQIDQLDSFIKLLRGTDATDADKKQVALTNLEKVSEELKDERSPDKARIIKWLDKAKDYFGYFKLGKEAFDLLKKVYESFNLTELISHLPKINL